jgi:hypothetical protein
MTTQTDWNSLPGYLRPDTLRKMREDLRDQLDDDNKQILEPFIEEISDMCSPDIDGDEAVSEDVGFV